jgi:phosphoribosylanthranilate isomerase
MGTWIKFCGITRPQDADHAVELDVSAIGLVLAPDSPRFISLRQAAIIRRRLPQAVKCVLLFMDAPADGVQRALERVQPDLLQFHGRETPAFCESFGWPYLRAVAMPDRPDLRQEARAYPGAFALLLDAHSAGAPGGQGRTFDWSAVPASMDTPLILAGGLNPDNVGSAVRQVRPFGVDVSSGIESAPGIKERSRMQRFIDEVRRGETG